MDVHHLQPAVGQTKSKPFAKLFAHWTTVCDQFNAAFKAAGLPIRFDCQHMLNNAYVDGLIDNHQTGENIEAFLDRGKVSGMMFPNQITTVVDVFASMYSDPGRCILVLGAMMCGKTGTAGATRLLGPIFYLSRGVKYYPIQLLPVRKGHEQQTHKSLGMWDSLYQDIHIHYEDVANDSDKVISLREYRAKAPNLTEHLEDDGSISLRKYTARVVRKRLTRHVMRFESRLGDVFAQLLNRRSRRRIEPIHELCLEAQKDGFLIVMIIDEPHWGSARDSVQDRMLARMKLELQDLNREHIVIGFDATPFQISNAASFKVVNHRLTADYCGPNCWGGKLLDPTVKTKDIILHTFESFAKHLGVPHFALINRGAYNGIKAYQRFAKKWNGESQFQIKWTHAEYKRQMTAALREALQKLVLNPADQRTRGVCVRLMKDNIGTANMIAKLQLDERITVIKYMSNSAHESVEDAIERNAPEGPYIVFVTGAARMADLFPQHCTVFLDWTDTVSSQVSLMQGSYGRACGYGEPRTVVMNKKAISGPSGLQNYIATKGAVMMNPGRQSVRPSSVRRGAPIINVRLGKGARDSVMDEVFERIQKQILDPVPFILEHGKPSMPASARAHRKDGNAEYVPFWRIFNERVLRHIETHHSTLLPEIALAPKILRIGETTTSKRGMPMKVAVDPTRSGYGKVGFRDLEDWIDKSYRSDNMQVKGKYFYIPADQTARRAEAEKEGAIQPQIWVLPNRRKKRWELEVLVLRLSQAVPGRNMITSDILPASRDLHYKYFLSEEQQLDVDSREAANRRRPRT